jgi:hypothetical protein
MNPRAQNMPNGKTPQELGYETEDVQWPLVLWSLGIVTGFTIISVFVLLWIFSFREAFPAFGQKAPVATAESRTVPTGPLLQADPATVMEKYKTESFAHINGYGWVDEEQGLVHIPIKDAMTIALEQGFPTGMHEPAAPEEAASAEDAGEDAQVPAEASVEAREEAP